MGKISWRFEGLLLLFWIALFTCGHFVAPSSIWWLIGYGVCAFSIGMTTESRTSRKWQNEYRECLSDFVAHLKKDVENNHDISLKINRIQALLPRKGEAKDE